MDTWLKVEPICFCVVLVFKNLALTIGISFKNVMFAFDGVLFLCKG